MVSFAPDFLLPVTRMSWKSFRRLPEDAYVPNSAHSDYQASGSLRRLCTILLCNNPHLSSNSRLAGVDRRASTSCKESVETQHLWAGRFAKPHFPYTIVLVRADWLFLI